MISFEGDELRISPSAAAVEEGGASILELKAHNVWQSESVAIFNAWGTLSRGLKRQAFSRRAFLLHPQIILAAARPILSQRLR